MRVVWSAKAFAALARVSSIPKSRTWAKIEESGSYSIPAVSWKDTVKSRNKDLMLS
jgi:hypothetical protein